jgi:hypothetical protein
VSDSPPALTLGFLSIFQDTNGYFGGYLVTNGWGRPLEFRLTSAVQPNRVQSVLYGPGLDNYIQAELIGKTLIEKTSVQPLLVVTDCPAALSMRKLIDVPILAVSSQADQPPPIGSLTMTHPRCRGSISYLSEFESDRSVIDSRLQAIDNSVDLLEPFVRIREAISEARRMGVASRAAA